MNKRKMNLPFKDKVSGEHERNVPESKQISGIGFFDTNKSSISVLEIGNFAENDILLGNNDRHSLWQDQIAR